MKAKLTNYKNGHLSDFNIIVLAILFSGIVLSIIVDSTTFAEETNIEASKEKNQNPVLEQKMVSDITTKGFDASCIIERIPSTASFIRYLSFLLPNGIKMLQELTEIMFAPRALTEITTVNNVDLINFNTNVFLTKILASQIKLI